MTSDKYKEIGVDLEEISRFSNKPFDENRAFYDKLFTKAEQEYCTAKKNPYSHFAARFCAKEALAKTLPVGMRPEWKEVGVISGESGKPSFQFNIQDEEKKSFIETLTFLLSLSHDKTQAIAFVTTENR